MSDLMPNIGVEPPKSTGYPQTEVEFLNAIWQALLSGSGEGSIQVSGTSYAHDWRGFTYYGATNNIQTITYKSGGAGGTVVAVQRFNYAGGGAANDDRVTVIATTSS